jgi:hypothetical protein
MSEPELMTMARRYAGHDDYKTTRDYIYGLLAIIADRDAEIADLKRRNEDLVKCINCFGEVATEAFK